MYTEPPFYLNFCLLGGVGLQADVLGQLAEEIKAKQLTEGHQRYIGLLQDEMKIKSDLVYCKHSGTVDPFNLAAF